MYFTNKKVFLPLDQMKLTTRTNQKSYMDVYAIIKLWCAINLNMIC